MKNEGEEEEKGYDKGQCSRRDKKRECNRRKQRSTTEEMETEAKGDLNHNPPLNFTRSRFTKDPRAGPTS